MPRFVKFRIIVFWGLIAAWASLSGCSSSKNNPGVFITSPPEDYQVDIRRECGRKYNKWRELSDTPINPYLGTSKIKQILSAVHNRALVYWNGCPAAKIDTDREKGFILLQLANEFEYVPTRYFLGEQLLVGDVIEQDITLGSQYLQQTIFCEPRGSDEYGDKAMEMLNARGVRYERQIDFGSQCSHIAGAYYKGPTLEFDAIAYKTDWESRSETVSRNLGWLGAGFRGTEQALKEVVPLALAGAAIYYSAKMSAQSQSGSYRPIAPPTVFSNGPGGGKTQMQSEFTQSRFTSSSGGFSNSFGVANSNRILSVSAPPPISISVTSGAGQRCRSDIECGLGRACVRPQQGLSLEGICGTLVDEFGVRDFSEIGPSVGPKEISGCSFTTDCPIGFRCERIAGDLYGVCVK